MTSKPLVTIEPVPAETVPVAETTAEKRARSKPSGEEIASWILMGGLIVFVVALHAVPMVIAALALYLILEALSGFFARHMARSAARPLALLLVTLIGGGIIIGVIALGASYLRHHVADLPALMHQMADIIQSTRAWLGGYGEQIIPEVLTDAETIKGAIVVWLKQHAEGLRLAGGTVSVNLVRMVLGMLLAIMVFFRHVTHHEEKMRGSLSRCLAEKVERFAHAFSRIASAQLKVTTINTFMIAMYLVAVLPLFGKHIPFTTTLIVLTFICGLVPLVGNVVSNIVIVILSLGVSVGLAVATLIFTIVVSKLQYVLNSRMVGSEIDAQAWEILLAIILGEIAFGVAGMVMAPIVYAFVKGELRERGLV